jgi:hypothetical protein
MTDIEKLIEKLKHIEALYSGTTNEGEKTAADNARQRVKEKIAQYQKADPPIEYKFTLTNTWSRKLLVALLRRYDIKPYRYYRQRRTTVMAKISESFVNETLWPEFQDLNKELVAHLDVLAEEIINTAVYQDSSEAEEIRAIAADSMS